VNETSTGAQPRVLYWLIVVDKRSYELTHHVAFDDSRSRTVWFVRGLCSDGLVGRGLRDRLTEEPADDVDDVDSYWDDRLYTVLEEVDLPLLVWIREQDSTVKACSV